MKAMQRRELATDEHRKFPRLYKVKTEALRKTREFFGKVKYRLAVAGTIAAAVVTFCFVPACTDLFDYETSQAPVKTRKTLTGQYKCKEEIQVGRNKSQGWTSLEICGSKGKRTIKLPFPIPPNRTKIKENNGVIRFKIRMGNDEISGFGLSKDDGSLALKVTKFGRFTGSMTIIYACQNLATCDGYVEYEKPEQYRKVVFTRPCPNKLYDSFGFDGKKRELVGGRTAYQVCADLRRNNVYDIFIPFKADDETYSPECGKQGDLLFNSTKYGYNRNQSFKDAHNNGFDPIKAFMDACTSVYKQRGKTVRFHAWFPVFSDRHAAAKAGLKARGEIQQGHIETAWNLIKRLFGKGESKYGYWTSIKHADPQSMVVVDYQMELLKEIVAKYQVAGINLDYIRYPFSDEPSEGYFDDQLQKESPEAKPSNYQWITNPLVIEDFVKRVRAEFPKLTVSADVFTRSWMRDQNAQQSILPHLDMIIPMSYTGGDSLLDSDLPIIKEVKFWNEDLRRNYPDTVLITLLGTWRRGAETAQNTADVFRRAKSDIGLTKESPVDGYGIFTYESLLRQTNSKSLWSIRKKIGF